MVDDAFVQEIARLAVGAEGVRTIEIDGRKYTDKNIFPVKLAEPATIEIDTLNAIKDYLTGNPDGLELAGTLVIVEAPDCVTVRSKLTGDFKQRFVTLKAKWPGIRFQFGQYMNVESFMIGLQADFMDKTTGEAVESDRKKILQIVGNVQDGVVRNFNDDGVTQQATVKVGVTRVDNIPVPNPVLLAPYRTFPEVDQPPSNFIFRMKSGQESPTCALFEADGGRWRTEAAKNVKEWLTENLPEGVTVLA